jgi:hypothetical protein
MRAPGGTRSRPIVAVLATAIAGIIACSRSSEPGPAFAATVALLAQSPPVTGATARYKVTLEFHGVWGLVTDASGTCPGVPPGIDTLTGVVQEQRSDDDEGSVYAGDFIRTSEVGLCEEQETPDGGRWCAGHLKGGGPVHVTLTIPALGNDNEQARVKLEPAAMAWATVSGTCSSLDNAAVAADYKAGDSIYFDTVNASGTSFLPTGKLTVGFFKQTKLAGPGGDGYTMKVETAP